MEECIQRVRYIRCKNGQCAKQSARLYKAALQGYCPEEQREKNREANDSGKGICVLFGIRAHACVSWRGLVDLVFIGIWYHECSLACLPVHQPTRAQSYARPPLGRHFAYQTPSYQLAPGPPIRPMAGHRFDTAFFRKYRVSNRLETDGPVVEADARAQTQFHYYYRRFAAGIDGVLMPSLSRMTAQKHRIEQDSCGSNDDSSTELDAIACMTSCSHYWLKGTWQRSFVLSWHFRSCTYTPSPHCLKIMFLTRPV